MLRPTKQATETQSETKQRQRQSNDRILRFFPPTISNHFCVVRGSAHTHGWLLAIISPPRFFVCRACISIIISFSAVSDRYFCHFSLLLPRRAHGPSLTFAPIFSGESGNSRNSASFPRHVPFSTMANTHRYTFTMMIVAIECERAAASCVEAEGG